MRAILTKAVSAWIDHRASSKGAALAFYTLFSMAPILVLAIAGAGYFFGADAARGEIIAQLEGLVGHSGALAIQSLLAGARNHASGLSATVIAGVLLMVGATAVFVELKGSLDELWGIEPPKGLAIVVFLRTQLHSFGIVLVLAFLLLVSLTLSAALAVLERYAAGIWANSFELFALLASAVSFGVIASLFAVIYNTARCTVVMARRLDRRRVHGGAVQPGEVRDRPVPRQQRRGLELRRGGLAGRVAALDLLLGADILPGRGIHAAIRARARQPSRGGCYAAVKRPIYTPACPIFRGSPSP
jgi:hypothetical protein